MSTRETSTPPPPRKRSRDYSTVQACRRALGALLNAVEAGDLETKRANAMFQGISILIGGFRDEQLGQIQAELEELKRAGVIRA